MTPKYKIVMPEKIEDMIKGVVYRGNNDYNSYILHHCDVCDQPMKVALLRGEPKWRVCRKCNDIMKAKYIPLPEKIEDMVEGVTYKDKWRAACVLHHCDICGKSMVGRIRKGKIDNRICIACFNQTDEKRELMSKCHKDIKQSDDFVQKRAEAIRLAYTLPEHKENLSKAMRGRVVSDETRKKVSESNKGQKHSIEQDLAHSIRMKEKWNDPIFKNEMLNKLFSSPKVTPTKPELVLDSILQKYFPAQWAYNGDNSCKFRIDGKIPDFVNLDGRLMLIELFSVHHCPIFRKNIRPSAIGKIRLELFKKFGYDCLIIWEPELKDIDHVVKKVKTFMGAS